MRHCLLTSFDKIYILNLHGNARKKETSPNGGKDENVFNIMAGVSINIFVKTSNKKDLATVYYADLFGTRKDKFDFLQKNTFRDISWQTLNFDREFYFFVPKDLSLQEKYNKGFSIVNLFPVNSIGIVTSNDNLFIAQEKSNLISKVTEKYNSAMDQMVQEIAYRPFDIKYVYYDEKLLERPRKKIMQHFIFKGKSYYHSFITNCLTESSYVSSKTSEIGTVFPLYLYNNENDQISAREPNFNIEIIKEIENKTGLVFTKEQENNTRCFAPIDVLDYIYGVLHSNKYRQKYNEFLKIDFPRVPYPKDANYFRQIAVLGKQIRELHLLESPQVRHVITSYPVAGNDTVECLIYEDNKVFINKTQYFAGVPKEAWEFWIGGHQPAQKWLKDRKGQQLSYEDLTHYQQMIVALFNTHNLMQEIDKIVEI